MSSVKMILHCMFSPKLSKVYGNGPVEVSPKNSVTLPALQFNREYSAETIRAEHHREMERPSAELRKFLFL